jgi:hypothetical protein
MIMALMSGGRPIGVISANQSSTIVIIGYEMKEVPVLIQTSR